MGNFFEGFVSFFLSEFKLLITCRTFGFFLTWLADNENSSNSFTHRTHSCGHIFWTCFDNFLGFSSAHYLKNKSGVY